ncbi:MAG: hypothetical protein J6Z35_07260 [Lachnospiraceae bacterium]|nr:hypothetical protein [Lachnospiraceae bacterium]
MKEKLPVPSGEYAVGTLTYTIYHDREEKMCQSGMRNIAARVYYPVLKSAVENLPKARYLSERMAKGLKKIYLLPRDYEKLEASGDNVSECYEKAPVVPGKKFPLIVFNHGYNSYREGNSYLCLEMASHGYVVISVAHSMEAVSVEFDDGSAIDAAKGLSQKIYQPFLQAVFETLKFTKEKGSNEELAEKFDILQKKYNRYLMDRMDEWILDIKAALSYAREHFGDFIDFERGIGASGHSFGGASAYTLCMDEADFVCGINIDGGLYGNHWEKVLRKPFLQISCKANVNVVTRGYVRHTKPVYGVLFRDMSHVGFSDMKFWLNMKSALGKLEPEKMHENLCRCHLEFFDAYLKGKKETPELKDNDVISVTVYAPDTEG